MIDANQAPRRSDILARTFETSGWGSSRIWLGVLFALSTLTYLYHFPEFNPDKLAQIQLSQSLLDGHGLTIPVPGSSARAELSQWPPMYPLLFAGILAITDSTWWSAFWIGCAAVLVYLVSWSRILAVLRTNGHLSPSGERWVWLYWIVSAAPFSQITSSGAVALAFFSASVALLFTAVAEGRDSVRGGVLAGGFACASAATRYAYLPVVAALPLALFVTMSVTKRRRWAMLLGYTVACGAILALSLVSQGHGSYVGKTLSSAQSHLFPGHLIRFAAFPIEVFSFGSVSARGWIFDDALALIHGLGWGSRGSTTLLLWIGSLPILGVIAARSRLPRVFDAKREGLVSGSVCFELIFAFVALATCGMLAFLSLRHPSPHGWSEWGWTYVEEVRYFALLFPFISIAFLSALGRGGDTRTHAQERLRRIGIVLAIFLVVGAGWHRLSGVVRHLVAEEAPYSWHSLEAGVRTIEALMRSTDPPPRVCVGADQWAETIAALAGCAVGGGRPRFGIFIRSTYDARRVNISRYRPLGDQAFSRFPDESELTLVRASERVRVYRMISPR
jgi:hypothetical protein